MTKHCLQQQQQQQQQQRHLMKAALQGRIAAANVSASIAPASGSNASGVTRKLASEPPTILWRPARLNQQIFGHAMINEALPMFLVLQNHFSILPDNLQLLTVGGCHAVLRRMLSGTITKHTAAFPASVPARVSARVPAGFPASTCYSQLVVGDGG
uniref:Uncharacterized protein n=1 Tax=Tetradesmus obliquus TaxID=3088 RepID=A0A383WK28_TETOB